MTASINLIAELLIVFGIMLSAYVVSASSDNLIFG